PALLTGDDEGPDANGAQVHFLFGSDFGEPERVSGCATENRRAVIHHHSQTRGAAQPAAREAEAADALRRFIGEPEADEGTERKGKEHAVGGRGAGSAQNLSPTRDHPTPTFRRVEPAQRRARGAAGPMQARVALERKGQVRSVRRPGALVV